MTMPLLPNGCSYYSIMTWNNWSGAFDKISCYKFSVLVRILVSDLFFLLAKSVKNYVLKKTMTTQCWTLYVMWSVKTRHMSQKVKLQNKGKGHHNSNGFFFCGLWTSVTFYTSIRGDPSKKFWKENNSNFHMISITQNINFAPCDGFSQITSHIICLSCTCIYRPYNNGVNK